MLADGYVSSGNVHVAVDESTLAGATDSATLERQLARLARGDCVGFGAWEQTTRQNVVPDGSCARYRLRVTNDDGRETVYGSPSVVRRDESPPLAPSISLGADGPDEHVSGTTLYYAPRPGSSGSFTVTASSDDPQSGLETLAVPGIFEDDGALARGGSVRATYTWTERSRASGEQLVTATSATGAESTAAFVVAPDLEPPSGGSVTYPDGVVSGDSVEIAVSPGVDALSGIDPASAVLERRVGSASGGECQLADAWTPASTDDSLPAGPACVQYRYRVADNVGNETVYTSPNTIRVRDAGAPTGAVTSPQGGSWLHGVVALSAEASDAGSGVASVRFQMAPVGADSWADIAAAGGSPWEVSWDTRSVGDGAYAVRVLTTDGDGNSSLSDPVLVNVDNTAPAALVAVPAHDLTGVVTIGASGDDAGSRVTTVAIQVAPAGGGWSTIASGAGPAIEAAFDSTSVEDGDYVFRSVVTDGAGNESSSAEVAAHVANAPDEEAGVGDEVDETSVDGERGQSDEPADHDASAPPEDRGETGTPADGGQAPGDSSAAPQVDPAPVAAPVEASAAPEQPGAALPAGDVAQAVLTGGDPAAAAAAAPAAAGAAGEGR